MRKLKSIQIKFYLSIFLTFLFIGFCGNQGYFQTITLDVSKSGHAISPIHHCLRWNIGWNGDTETGLVNSGYWGIRQDNNTKYKASFFARKDSVFEKIGKGFNGTLTVKLESNDGVVYASSDPITITTEWKQYTCEHTTKADPFP